MERDILERKKITDENYTQQNSLVVHSILYLLSGLVILGDPECRNTEGNVYLIPAQLHKS